MACGDFSDPTSGFPSEEHANHIKFTKLRTIALLQINVRFHLTCNDTNHLSIQNLGFCSSHISVLE